MGSIIIFVKLRRCALRVLDARSSVHREMVRALKPNQRPEISALMEEHCYKWKKY